MRKIDKENLRVYNELYIAFSNLSDKYGIHSNIIGVFFHEIMIYLTNYNIIKSDRVNYTSNISFPFLNTDYCLNPKIIDYRYLVLKKKISFRLKIINFFFKNIFSLKKIKIEIDKSLIKILSPFIVKNIFNYKFSTLKENKVYIRNNKEQIDILRKVLLNIINKYDINNKNIFIENFINYISCFISEEPIKVNSDILLVGSNSSLFNRINSANYLYSNKKVISFAHGDVIDFLSFDEPYFGYGEFSYCDYYISFGSNSLTFARYNKPLKGYNPKFYKINSKTISGLFCNKNIINLPITKEMKGLYIPTGFSQNQRYGPFRDMSDKEYIKWQKEIFRLSLDITYKAHPTSKINFLNKKQKVSYFNLKECVNEYDYYIVDYISTAIMIVCATNKPVIYFDLGLRNMKDEFLFDLKNRVHYYKIDFKQDIFFQLENAILSYSDFTYSNDFIQKYSLSDNSMEKVISNILES